METGSGLSAGDREALQSLLESPGMKDVVDNPVVASNVLLDGGLRFEGSSAGGLVSLTGVLAAVPSPPS